MKCAPDRVFVFRQTCLRAAVCFTVAVVSSISLLAFPYTASAASAAVPSLSQVSGLPPVSDSSLIKILDVRREEICREESLSSATCVPIEDFFADRGRLANFSGLYWLLGTVGLTGAETVYLVGEDERRKQVMAALLFVAGQERIAVVQEPLASLGKRQLNGHQRGKPQQRAKTRVSVYTASPRTERIVLKQELLATLSKPEAPVLVDGRSESEYWGRRIRAARGGHLPGAIWLSSFDDIGQLNSDSNNATPVLYGQDAVESLALLALAELSGFAAGIYLAGWVEWAADMQLPVDAEVFPSSTRALPKRSEP